MSTLFDESDTELERIRIADARERVAKGTPFSIACSECDAGQGLTLDRALILGWTDIEYDDGPSWNFLGECPDCRGERLAREKAEL